MTVIIRGKLRKGPTIGAVRFTEGIPSLGIDIQHSNTVAVSALYVSREKPHFAHKNLFDIIHMTYQTVLQSALGPPCHPIQAVILSKSQSFFIQVTHRHSAEPLAFFFFDNDFFQHKSGLRRLV